VAAILSFGQIFGAELSDNNLFRSSVLKAYLAIASGGARAATAALVAT
jgi:mannitol-1-phosphate/altronate dehydrogenase